MTIVGYQKVSFKADDGKQIDGATLYVTEPLDPKRGTGESTNKFFLSAAKLEKLPFALAVGLEVQPLYNRFGKIETLNLTFDSDDQDDEIIDG